MFEREDAGAVCSRLEGELWRQACQAQLWDHPATSRVLRAGGVWGMQRKPYCNQGY